MHSDFNLTEIVLKHNVTTWSFRDHVVTSSSQDLMRDLHWTLEMDSNQSGAVGGTIWVPFHLSSESLKPLKWPDIAKIKPGFVEFGLGWSWRVHEMLQYLSFDNIETLGQLGCEINVKCVRRSRNCVICLLYDDQWKSFHWFSPLIFFAFTH